jgi:adenylate cyclase
VVFRGQNLSPQDAARELGVDYLLQGSVRRESHRIRITVHLVDGRSAAELWADRFDGPPSDLFELQDRVAEWVAGAIEPVVQEDGVQAASRRPTANLDSWDLYLRALPPFRASRKTDMLHAIEFLERALELDPGFAVALGQSSVCHRQIVDHDWSADPDAFRRRGRDYAERALVAAPDDARVLALAAAGLSGLENRVDRSLVLTERAIALNPASPFVWLISGSVRLRAGQPDLAAEHLERAIRLDPISVMGGMARMYLASCRFQQRRFEESLTLFGTTSFRLPLSHVILASLYGHLGRTDAARAALSTFEGLSAGTIEKFAQIWFPREGYRTLFLAGLSAVRE